MCVELIFECLAEVFCYLFCTIFVDLCEGICKNCKCNGNCEDCCKCNKNKENMYASSGFGYNQTNNKLTYVDTYQSVNDVNNVTTSQPTRTRIAQPLEQNYCPATNQPVSHLSDAEIIFGSTRPEDADAATPYGFADNVNNATTYCPRIPSAQCEHNTPVSQPSLLSEEENLLRPLRFGDIGATTNDTTTHTARTIDYVPVPQPAVLSEEENLLRPLRFGGADTTPAYGFLNDINNVTTTYPAQTHVPSERHEQTYPTIGNIPIQQSTVLSEEENLLRPLRFGGPATTSPFRFFNDSINITATQPAGTHIPSAPHEQDYYSITNMPVSQPTVQPEEESLLRPLRFGGNASNGADLPPSYEEATKSYSTTV